MLILKFALKKYLELNILIFKYVLKKSHIEFFGEYWFEFFVTTIIQILIKSYE